MNETVLVIPRGKMRGTWQLDWRKSRPNSATVICPECGWLAGLDDHTIRADGSVRPSVVCPNPACTWHVFIQLEGWEQKEKTNG